MLKTSQYKSISHIECVLMVATGGYQITNPVQREHSVSFLRQVQNIMGFKTQSTIALLRSQWQDLDGSA